MHSSAGCHGGQKQVSDPLELDLQVVVCSLCMLGTELTSERATAVLTAETLISPAHHVSRLECLIDMKLNKNDTVK